MNDISSLSIPDSEIDTDLLDLLVREVERDPSNKQYFKVLTQFQKRPDAYKCCIPVFSKEYGIQTRYLVLKILRNYVESHWNLIEDNEKSQIHEFVLKFIHDENYLQNNAFITLADQILVSILKYEYPQNFPNFISDRINESSQNEILQMNCIEIISILAREISIGAEESLTIIRASQLKEKFSKEFPIITKFIQNIFLNNPSEEIIIKAVRAIKTFVQLIDMDNIFQIGIFGNLHILYDLNFHIFVEVSSIFWEICQSNNFPPEFGQQVPEIFSKIMETVQKYTQSTDILDLLSSETDKITFCHTVTGLIQKYYKLILPLDKEGYISYASTLLVSMLSNFNDEPLQICIDFWAFIATTAYREKRCQLENTTEIFLPYINDVTKTIVPKIVNPFDVFELDDDPSQLNRYSIEQNIIYDSMHDYLLHATQLYPQETCEIINEFIHKENITVDDINVLCWCIGCIGNGFEQTDNEDFSFLSNMINSIINLLESTEENDIKISIISGISFSASGLSNFFSIEDNISILSFICHNIIEILPSVESTTEIILSSNFNKVLHVCSQLLVSTPSGCNNSIVESCCDELFSIFGQVSSQSFLLLVDGLCYCCKRCESDIMRSIVEGLSFQIFESIFSVLNTETFIFFLRCLKIISFNNTDYFVRLFIDFSPHLIDLFNKNFDNYETNEESQNICFEILDLYCVISSQISSHHENLESFFEICCSTFLSLYFTEKFSFFDHHVLQIFGNLSLKLQNKMPSKFLIFYNNLFVPVSNLFREDINYIQNNSLLCTSFIFLIKCFVRTSLSSLLCMESEQIRFFFDTFDNLILYVTSRDIRDLCFSVLEDIFTTVDKMQENASRRFMSEYGVKYLVDIVHYMVLESMSDIIGHLSSIFRRLIRNRFISENISQFSTIICERFDGQNVDCIERFLFSLRDCMNQRDFRSNIRDFIISLKHFSPLVFNTSSNDIVQDNPQHPENLNNENVFRDTHLHDISSDIKDLSQKLEFMSLNQ
ncbi:hypothetical protein TVAG_053590 [Trichomonas vaginalis G3]|uniref:Importin N-terminal domain-containing protein n=1 Tax=Trichomonas vaginalis (strain ATCC PRA-98 / G3) TaxID=412133 RepID=A2EMW2_TRIV3|nr:nuclear export signal receptor protein [Trichomonas vaginalis G3]EAY06035.1 hypothetical protein TVAG_053590 [Trichomonas vaginalis G3]KAI5512837.1 nuclear export signal receptor protein [Trichomonas vaginalis G3]|eukprot:XP_001318258.1 hypothetical protein [Trichomonas vaginalis G3]